MLTKSISNAQITFPAETVTGVVLNTMSQLIVDGEYVTMRVQNK